MPLPLAAVAIKAGASMLGSHALRAKATEFAFDVGGKALGNLLPSLGKDPGVGGQFVPTLSTLGQTAAVAPGNTGIGRLLGKSDLIADLASALRQSPAAASLGGPALGALASIGSAASAFSSTQSSLSLFSAAKSINLSSLKDLPGPAGEAAGRISDIFAGLIEDISRFTGQAIDNAASVAPPPAPHTPEMH